MTPELLNNLKIKAELLELSRAFSARGIEHAVLKGVPLVLRLYQQLDARFIGDNDVLIRGDAQEQAGRVLSELGYRPKRDPAVSLRYDGRATFKRQGQQEEALVDLHVKAFDPLLFAVSDEQVWSRLEQFDLGDLRVAVLDRELTLLHQAAHCAQHAMLEPRTLRDFARAWNDWGDRVDLATVQRLAREFGLLDAFVFALWVARDLGMLRRAPPDWSAARAVRLRKILSTRRLLRPTTAIGSDGEPRLPYLRLAAMGLLLSAAQQRHFLRSYLFPPAAKLGTTATGVALWGHYARRLIRPLINGIQREPRNASVRGP